MPNGFAYFALLSWPLVTFLIFRAMPIPKAIAWTIVGGYLLLPGRAGFDIPLLPPIDKTLVPAVSAAVMTLIMMRDPRTPRPEPPGQTGKWLVRALLGLMIVTPFVTVLTNPEPVVAGPLYIPGLRVYDAFGVVNDTLVVLIPFILAQRFLATEAEITTLLKILVLAGLVYSAPTLFEIRMSPQLNTWIYGFFRHSFAQHIRGDGFRPIVFLAHGLWLAIFLATCILAAASLWRARRGERYGRVWLPVALYLLVVLVLAKSIGALLITALFLPVLLVFGARMQLLVAVLVAMMVLFYPLLRGTGLIPVEPFIEAVEKVMPERAQSFEFRVRNEDQLLERANEKPFAGWGDWGRSRIYDEVTGRDRSVSDGAWIILIGRGGWLGYLTHFGLLTVPTVLLWIHRKRYPLSLGTSGLAVILAANLLDLVPNATLTPLTWLMAGALAGRMRMVGSGTAMTAAPAGVRRRQQALTRPRAMSRAVRRSSQP